MNIKRKHVMIGLALLAITWAGNIFYYQKHILKEPLFIKQYCDVNQGRDSFNLYYISNINEKNEMAFITFPEIDPAYVRTEKWKHNSDNRYYNFNILNVKINEASDGKIPEEIKNKVLTKARLHLRDGKTVDVNIGKIYLFCDETRYGGLQEKRSSASNNLTGSRTFLSTEDLKIYGVSTKFPELMNGTLEISINDLPLKDIKFPINVNSGEWVQVRHKMQFNEDDINRNNSYDFSIYLLTENEAGEKGASPVFINYWLQSPEEYDIPEMISDRGDD